jgi:hypothetical protein
MGAMLFGDTGVRQWGAPAYPDARKLSAGRAVGNRRVEARSEAWQEI